MLYSVSEWNEATHILDQCLYLLILSHLLSPILTDYLSLPYTDSLYSLPASELAHRLWGLTDAPETQPCHFHVVKTWASWWTFLDITVTYKVRRAMTIAVGGARDYWSSHWVVVPILSLHRCQSLYSSSNPISTRYPKCETMKHRDID